MWNNIPNDGGITGNPFMWSWTPSRTQCEGIYRHPAEVLFIKPDRGIPKKQLEDRIKNLLRWVWEKHSGYTAEI